MQTSTNLIGCSTSQNSTVHGFLWPFINDIELVSRCEYISLKEGMFCSALTLNLCSHLLRSIGCQISWYHWFLCHVETLCVSFWLFRHPSEKISFCTLSRHVKWLLNFVTLCSFMFYSALTLLTVLFGISKGKVRGSKLCRLIKHAAKKQTLYAITGRYAAVIWYFCMCAYMHVSMICNFNFFTKFSLNENERGRKYKHGKMASTSIYNKLLI